MEFGCFAIFCMKCESFAILCVESISFCNFVCGVLIICYLMCGMWIVCSFVRGMWIVRFSNLILNIFAANRWKLIENNPKLAIKICYLHVSMENIAECHSLEDRTRENRNCKFLIFYSCIVITLYLHSCHGQETAKEPFSL